MTKRKRWFSKERKDDARYAESLPITDSFITGIQDVWAELLGKKWDGQIMRFSFTQNATSESNVTVQTLTKTGGWSQPKTIPLSSLSDYGMDGSS